MSIKVSIIVPVYNTERYLEKCICSIINQTLQEIEVLIVDDGSTDSSLVILKKFQERYPEKVKVFAKENGGQASARNFALPFAQGKYIGFVDSDDWIDCDMYEKMYQKAENDNADIVICDMVEHFPEETVYHDASVFDSKFKVSPSACNKIFRTTILQNDIFPLGLWYEDFEFTTKQLMKTNEISVIHEGFYHYYYRETSTMHNDNSIKNLDILVVLKNLCQFVEINKWNNKYDSVLEYLYIEHVLITAINRVQLQNSCNKSRVIKKLRKEVLNKYPDFYRDDVFKEMSGKRKIITVLNAYGFSGISHFLLQLKNRK